MSQKAFSLVAVVIFLLVAVAHLLRLLLRWSVILNGWTVPHSLLQDSWLSRDSDDAHRNF
jgi:hypothetical protein